MRPSRMFLLLAMAAMGNFELPPLRPRWTLPPTIRDGRVFTPWALWKPAWPSSDIGCHRAEEAEKRRQATWSRSGGMSKNEPEPLHKLRLDEHGAVVVSEVRSPEVQSRAWAEWEAADRRRRDAARAAAEAAHAEDQRRRQAAEAEKKRQEAARRLDERAETIARRRARRGRKESSR